MSLLRPPISDIERIQEIIQEQSYQNDTQSAMTNVTIQSDTDGGGGSDDDGGCCAGLRHRGREGRSSSTPHQASIQHVDYESLDYDCYYSNAFKEEKMQRPETKGHRFKVSFMQWSLMFLIGLVTALVALFIDYFTSQLTSLKFNTVADHLDGCEGTSCMVESLLMMCGFNVLFATVAACFVCLEPNAAGSGIPEIKCYLNGIKIPRVTRLRTLVSKACGVLFSVSGGLFVGKEGPMIHSGAIIGAGLPQFRSFACRWLDLRIKTFRRDRDKRDFVSGGAAAGVAAAFGAPIGGVLFSLEEGSSFWNQQLTWRTFFCAMAATFSLNFFLSGIRGSGWGSFFRPGLVDFGTFQCPDEKECHLWTAQDLFVFLCMAVVGGLLGALFNYINTLITILRMRYLQPRHKIFRVLEVITVALVTTLIAFISAMMLGECREIGRTNVTDTRTYFCPEGEYNDMATLFFNPQEVAIKQLFHQDGTFSPQSLAIFFVFFFFLACWTYGIGVPSGLFVPCLLCGAAYGRLVSTLLVDYAGYHAIYRGSFALVGSAAFLGGVVRMTISLTVILIESTNEITYGLPIMIVLMVAKWVGDLFNEGIYDIHIELKEIPFLGWDHPPGIDSLTAKDVMKTELCYIHPYTRVKSVFKMLQRSKHNAFPVVTFKKELKDENKGKSVSINDRFRKDSMITRMGEQKRRADTMLAKRRNTLDLRRDGDGQRPTSALAVDRASRYGSQGDPYAVPDTEVSDDQDYRPLLFHGMMLRSHLTVLLKERIFVTESAMLSSPVVTLSQDQLLRDYPRFPDVGTMDEADFPASMLVDVTRYMNPSPYTVWPETPLPQVFHLFRSMGLRHLPVVNCEGEILGIITRHNLALEALEDAKENMTAETGGAPQATSSSLARPFARSTSLYSQVV